MFEPAALLPEDAPRPAVLRALRAWSQRRAPSADDPPGSRQEAAALAALADGDPGCWDAFCELVFSSGLHLDMLSNAPGLWSHCRLAAGANWRGIATMTRGLARHLASRSEPAGEQGAGSAGRAQAAGAGSVAIDGERLWLADHLLYACQDDLEVGLDCRFYGCARDPDLHGISAQRYRWSFAQKRWYVLMAGLTPPEVPQAGWISSPRWLFPLPAHALPRAALAGPLGERLWRAGLAAAESCPASVSAHPQPWWQDHGLVPAPAWAGRWAARAGRTGFGVLSLEAIAARPSGDPCQLAMTLAACAPGAALPAGRAWALIAALARAQRGLLAPSSGARRGAPVVIDLALPSGGHRLRAEQDGDWCCINGWALSRALGAGGLMPPFRHLLGLNDWPPSTLLRSGLAEVLRAYAAPVRHHGSSVTTGGNSVDAGKLTWSWTDPGVPTVPSGWELVDPALLAHELARPGWVECEGGTIYA